MNKFTASRKMPVVGVVLGAAVLASLPFFWNRVVEVVDGDTFILANRTQVRLLGVDAPETGFCGSQEAKDLLVKEVLNKKVTLTEIKTDKWNRLLAVAYVGDRMINKKLLESGLARWDGTNNNLGNLLKEASDKAREEKAGVYGICHFNPGSCEIKGNIEKSSKGNKGGRKFYFFPGCSEYESVVVERELGERWFCSEKEAKAEGYQKAGNCFDKSYR